MPRKKYLSSVKSEGSDTGGQKESDGGRFAQTPNKVNKPRAPGSGSGVDIGSAQRHFAEPMVRGAPDFDQAVMAGDQSRSTRALDTVKVRTKKSTHGVEDRGLRLGFPDTGAAPLLPDIPLPKPYDGRADQRLFDIWAHDVTFWAKFYGLSDQQVMHIFHRFISGRVKSYFIMRFSPSPHLPPTEWSLEEAFQVIHKYCFPIDHKSMLYKEIMSATQGNLSVRDFATEIQWRAKHLPYISEQKLATIFLSGLNLDLRIQLIKNGKTGKDYPCFETLLTHALRYDHAYRMSQDSRIQT